MTQNAQPGRGRGKPDWLTVQLVACLAIAGLLLPVGLFLESPYSLNILIITVIFAVMGVGWVIGAGLTGLLLIGYISFFGVGAYTSALLFTKFGVSPWLGMPLAGAVGAGVAVLVGVITLRFGLREDYFGLFTVAVSQIFLVLLLNWDFAGRATGIYITVISDDFWTMQFVDRRPYLIIALGLFVAATLVAYAIMRGRFGLLLAAVRNNPAAAEALGIEVSRVRIQALAVSGAIAGVAGAFYAQFTTFIDPKQVFGLALNFDFLLVPVLGGRFSLVGPIIGAFALRPTKDLLRAMFGGVADAVFLVIYGLLLVVFILLLPRGAAGFLEDRYKSLGRKDDDGAAP
ncbi:MAG: branched-chain amino acid ABC transporter permease [Pseudomonadota bacterium]